MARKTSTRTRGLVEERDFLLRSIEDLEKEHRAGDIDEVDYELLRTNYTERAAHTLREIEEKNQEPLIKSRVHPKSFGAFLGQRRVRLLAGSIAAACFLGLVLVLAFELAGIRLPGQSSSGTISLSSGAQANEDLLQAGILAGDGNVTEAVKLYDAVLKIEPDNGEALTYKGWFIRLGAIATQKRSLLEQGDASLEKAALVAPSYADGRGLYGVALLEDRSDPRAAVTEFRAFLADDPATNLLKSLSPTMATAFKDLHLDLPPAIRRYAA